MTVKIQHYTPRLHLRQFTEDFRLRQGADPAQPWWYESEDGMIFVLDRHEVRKYRTNIKNVAAESYFYDLPDELERQIGGPQAVEKRLADLEEVWNRAGRVLFTDILDVPKLLSASHWHPERVLVHLNTEVQVKLATFVAWQVVRTRFFRDHAVKRHLAENRGRSPEEAEAYVQQYFAEWLLVGDQLARFASLLMEQIWILGFNGESEPFYTSDQPVTGFAGSQREALAAGMSLVPRSFVFIVPLNYQTVLQIFEAQYWASHRVGEYAQTLGRLNGYIWRSRPRTIRQYNRMQVYTSQRRVFSPTDVFAHADGARPDWPRVP